MKKSIFSLLALTACGSAVEHVECPSVSLVAELLKTSTKNAAGAVARTEVDSVYPRCEQEGRLTHVDMALRFTTFRISKDVKESTFRPQYFLARVDAQNRILEKEIYDLPVTLSEDQMSKVTKVGLSQEMTSRDEKLLIGMIQP